MTKYLKVLPFLLAIFLIAAGSAMALPMLSTVTGETLSPDYSDTGAEFAFLTDTDGDDDDASAFLLFEFAGFAASNDFGIYGFTDDGSGNITLGETLEVFDGGDTPGSPFSRTLHFNILAGTVTVSGGATKNIGTQFGFYIDSPDGIFYSHLDLNTTDNADHALIYDTSDNLNEAVLGPADLVIALEDLLQPNTGEAIPDFNDMVVGITDVSVVPEPSTMIISSLFLIGAGFYVRKKLHKNS